MVFALQLWNIVRTRQVRTWEIVSVIIGDLTWVAGSLVLVDLVALAVLIFAILQIRGLRQFRTVS